MSRLTRKLRQSAPAWMVLPLEWISHSVFPSGKHKRENRILQELGGKLVVLHGPFEGMRYHRLAGAGSIILPKVLGTTEKELLPAIGRMIQSKPDLVVNVGSAEGWYAVGMALRLPGSKILAYDIATWPRYLLRKIARMNGCAGNIEQRSWCSPNSLESDLAAARNPAVICDCEGYEIELLDPAKAPSLSKARVLVELHDHVHPGLKETLLARFGATHHIEVIPQARRNASDLPPGVRLHPDDIDFALNEGRGRDDMNWLYMTPHTAL